MILLIRVQSYCKSPIFQNKMHFFCIFSYFIGSLEIFFCTFAVELSNGVKEVKGVKRVKDVCFDYEKRKRKDYCL